MTLLSYGNLDNASAAFLRWTPSLTFSERYDDNVFLQADKTADYVSVLVPQLHVSSSVEEVPVLIQYRAQIERYARKEELNTIKHFAGLAWTTPVTKTASLTLTDGFSFTPDSTEITSIGVVGPRGNAYSNDVSAQLQFSKVNLSYQHGLQEFEAAELSDSQSHNFEERLELPLSVRHVATQSYRFRYFIQNGEASLHSHTVGIGLRYRFSPTFSIGAEGGAVYWRTLSDDSYRLKPTYRLNIDKSFKFKRLSLNFSFIQEIRPLLRAVAEYRLRNGVIQMNVSKDLSQSSGLLGGVADLLTTGIRFQQPIRRNLTIDLSAGYRTQKTIAGDQGRFESYRGEANLVYHVRDWLRTSLGYSYFKQDSKSGFGFGEFTRNQATISLTAVMP